MTWPPPEIEEMYRQQQAAEDRASRIGLNKAICICMFFWGLIAAAIMFWL